MRAGDGVAGGAVVRLTILRAARRGAREIDFEKEAEAMTARLVEQARQPKKKEPERIALDDPRLDE